MLECHPELAEGRTRGSELNTFVYIVSAYLWFGWLTMTIRELIATNNQYSQPRCHPEPGEGQTRGSEMNTFVYIVSAYLWFGWLTMTIREFRS